MLPSNDLASALRCPRCGACALRRAIDACTLECQGCGAEVAWSRGFGDFTWAGNDPASGEEAIARRYDGLGGASYDWLVRHAFAAELLFWRFWGASHAAAARRIAARFPEAKGARVLDLPVGGGAALVRHRASLVSARWVVGVDLSAGMLARAARRLAALGTSHVALVRAPATRLPLADATVDQALAVNSLHCFVDPGGALRELRRVLAPGGVLVGSCIVRGAGPAADRRIERMRERGHFAAALERTEIERALGAAGLEAIGCDQLGAVLVFAARG